MNVLIVILVIWTLIVPFTVTFATLATMLGPTRFLRVEVDSDLSSTRLQQLMLVRGERT